MGPSVRRASRHVNSPRATDIIVPLKRRRFDPRVVTVRRRFDHERFEDPSLDLRDDPFAFLLERQPRLSRRRLREISGDERIDILEDQTLGQRKLLDSPTQLVDQLRSSETPPRSDRVTANPRFRIDLRLQDIGEDLVD